MKPAVRTLRQWCWAVWCWAVWCGLVCMLWQPQTAQAHELKPAVLALKEVSAGRFLVNWAGASGTGPLTTTQPRFPAHCQVLAGDSEPVRVVDCGHAGLVGDIEFEPAGLLPTGVTVHVTWLGGAQHFAIAQGHPLHVELMGLTGELEPQQRLALALHYLQLGVEHIWFGPDHLLFVLGLMLIVRARRPLIWTITAFTLAHSLTLAAASLELAHVPTAPVELCIALSVLLLAFEASQRHSSWMRSAPWAVAFLFGLLHGLGFASALSEVGLPAQHVAVSLLSFNVGVELGQLCVIAVAALLWKSAVHTERAAQRAEFAVTVLVGTAATVWTLQRLEAFLFAA